MWNTTYKLCFLQQPYCLSWSFPPVILLSSNILSWHVLSLFECSTYWKAEDEAAGGMIGLGGDADTHSYVSFTINLVWTTQVPLSCWWKIPSPRIPFDINKWTGMMTLYISIGISILCFTYIPSLRTPVEFSESRGGGGDIMTDRSFMF